MVLVKPKVIPKERFELRASALSGLVNAGRLGSVQRIAARLWGRHPAFKADPCGKGVIQYYFGYCSTHGYYVNYPQGHYEKLYCPECDDEILISESLFE